jgi:hypothetical protein
MKIKINNHLSNQSIKQINNTINHKSINYISNNNKNNNHKNNNKYKEHK